MDHLKHTGWITYSTKPRSLQVGSRGHAWLTVTGQPPPASPPHTGTRDHQAETVSLSRPRLHRARRDSQWTLPRFTPGQYDLCNRAPNDVAGAHAWTDRDLPDDGFRGIA